MTQEALKLALEALEWCHGGEPCGTAEAIVAIKEALAQPQEALKALIEDLRLNHEFCPKEVILQAADELERLARHDSVQAKPEQEQEPVAHWSDCAVHNEPAYPKGKCDCGGFATPPQEQEPDYKLLFDELAEKFALLRDEAEMWKKQALFRFDATATPPQRTWVGLTDEERKDIALEVPIEAVLITEAKLKDKNCVG